MHLRSWGSRKQTPEATAWQICLPTLVPRPEAAAAVAVLWVPLVRCPKASDAGPFLGYNNNTAVTLQQPDIRRHLDIFSLRLVNNRCAPAQHQHICLGDSAFCLHQEVKIHAGCGIMTARGLRKAAQIESFPVLDRNANRLLCLTWKRIGGISKKTALLFPVECKQQHSQSPPAEQPYKGNGAARRRERPTQTTSLRRRDTAHNDGIHIGGRGGLLTTSN